MMTSRKALISNLNYVHLQHVSLGVHLSMRSETMDGPVGQDTSLKCMPAHQHQCKDTSDTLLVDANSNDPSVPCQCCDQHSSHAETIKYNSNENLETIMCDDYLSPDDLPLSPFSPSSPSTDSSSSSDFTLDDSPVSMYYREYAQDDLETPDQQPDIIPLDMENSSSLDDSIDHSIDPSEPMANIALVSESQGKIPENAINNNFDPEDVPFIDWSSDTVLDSNCNALLDTPQPDPPSSSLNVDVVVGTKPQSYAAEKDDVANANQVDVPQWPSDEELFPSLSVPEDSTQTPKKTITSFHELAQKRRRSGGLSQPKKDKSDWLIVFSPDVEQPPVNELTASAFYHGLVVPQAQPLAEGKEVTTFRELRYRNSVNKLIGTKSNSTPVKGSQELTEGAQEAAPNNTHVHLQNAPLKDAVRESEERERGSQEGNNGSARAIQKPDMKLDTQHRVWVHNDHQSASLEDSLSAMAMGKHYPSTSIQDSLSAMTMGKHHPSTSIQDSLSAMAMGKHHPSTSIHTRREEIPPMRNKTVGTRRGLADGGDRRGLEAALPPPRLLLRLSTNLTPPPALLPRGSTHEVPRCFAPPLQPWYPQLPVRLSPVGAYSPPQRALLPLLDTPDVAILLSPLFPRTRRRETGPPPRAPTADSPDTGCHGDSLMADAAGDDQQQDKKGLLVTIGAAVDRIISHFNGSRNQVQKAQLGDSRLSPKLGYLILNSLCPSLFTLLGDGLKPFQKDVIVGRRRLNPWNLVEVSTKSGPESLHIVFYNVNHFQQLRDPQRKFNAFIFGLLNTKQLDIWLSHLLQIFDQLAVFFLPSGFLPLAATSHPELREELLLILQPLSALTFHTDLLFEHHHLPLQEPPTPHHPPSQTLADNWGVPPLQHILDLGGWLAHNLAGNADREKSKESQTPPLPTFGAGREPQNDGDLCAGDRAKDPFYDNQRRVSSPDAGITNTATQQRATSKTKDSSTTWWGQLGQASRLYMPANKDSFSFSSFRKLREAPDKQPDQKSSSKVRESTEQRLHKEPRCEKAENETELLRQPSRSSNNLTGEEGPAERQRGPTRCNQPVVVNPGPTTPTQSSEEKGGWFGQLFGANSAHSRELEARNVKSRRPSSWLPPNVNVLDIIRLLSTAEREPVLPAEQEEVNQTDIKPVRSLRALCDHVSSGEAQLSFKKGDILQVLGTVDEDWIRCRRGSDTGLVPVGYTSLIL